MQALVPRAAAVAGSVLALEDRRELLGVVPEFPRGGGAGGKPRRCAWQPAGGGGEVQAALRGRASEGGGARAPPAHRVPDQADLAAPVAPPEGDAEEPQRRRRGRVVGAAAAALPGNNGGGAGGRRVGAALEALLQEGRVGPAPVAESVQPGPTSDAQAAPGEREGGRARCGRPGLEAHPSCAAALRPAALRAPPGARPPAVQGGGPTRACVARRRTPASRTSDTSADRSAGICRRAICGAATRGDEGAQLRFLLISRSGRREGSHRTTSHTRSAVHAAGRGWCAPW